MRNKHVVTAAIVAPVLALIGYFGINALVGESPHAAEEGQSYQLVEMPTCRYDSGHCVLRNGDFELDLSTESLDGGRMLLMLKSEFPLDGVKVALVEDQADEKHPVDMRPVGADGLQWSLEIVHPDPEHSRLHLVASANQSLYFGDAAMKFTLQEGR